MGIIYQVRNILNDKVYIVSTKMSLSKRKAVHLGYLRHNRHHSFDLQIEFNMYGEDQFKFEKLYECADDLVRKYEQDEIDTYLINGELDKTRCYNLSKAVHHLSLTKGTSLSEEVKKRMRESWTDSRRESVVRKLSGERNPFYGKTHSKEVLEIISKTHLGSKRTEECKQKMSETRRGKDNGFYGRKHSDETRAKMVKAWTVERRLKMVTNNPNSKTYKAEINTAD